MLDYGASYLDEYYTGVLLSMGASDWFQMTLYIHEIYPPSFGTLGRLLLDITVAPYSIYLFIYFLYLFYSTGEPAGGDNPGDVANIPNGLQRQKRQLAIGLSLCLIRGSSKK